MQEHRQKRTESELQLWEISAPRQSQARSRQNQARSVQSQARSRQNQARTGYSQVPAGRKAETGRPVNAAYRKTNYKRKSDRTGRRSKRGRAKYRRILLYRCLAFCIFILFLAGVFWLTGVIYRSINAHKQGREVSLWESDGDQYGEPVESKKANLMEKPKITVDLLEQNEYSRPGTKLKKVKNIFVHYTANPGTSAKQNRSYFSNLAKTGERSASAHYIIGYEGEIIQCIPLEEEAFAVMGRNDDSVSVECCYLSEDGAFTQFTYDSLIQLLAWLCGEYELSAEDILRHYDEGGKKCPLYYVEHEEDWEKLKEDVGHLLENAAL